LASKETEIGEKTQNKGDYAIQGHPRLFKVIEVSTNRKPVCDFLLVINSNMQRSKIDNSKQSIQTLDKLLYKSKVFSQPHGPSRNANRHFHVSQSEISLHCKTMYVHSYYLKCLFTPQLCWYSLHLPMHGWPGIMLLNVS